MIDFLHHGEPPFTVILCHGFGADMHDLVPITDSMQMTGPLRWVFPQAPVPLPGYPSGRAWFPRTAPELEAFASGASFHDLSQTDPPGLRDSAEEVHELLEHLAVDHSRCILGGFSQGAMVAVETALTAGGRFAGIAILSGSLIAADRWTRLAHGLRGTPVFQSHGRGDPLLPYSQARRLYEVLTGAGAEVAFTAFDGGHGIPAPAMTGLAAFIRERSFLPPSTA